MKPEVIYIRCSRETKRDLKIFMAKRGITDYEVALKELLTNYQPRKFSA